MLFDKCEHQLLCQNGLTVMLMIVTRDSVGLWHPRLKCGLQRKESRVFMLKGLASGQESGARHSFFLVSIKFHPRVWLSILMSWGVWRRAVDANYSERIVATSHIGLTSEDPWMPWGLHQEGQKSAKSNTRSNPQRRPQPKGDKWEHLQHMTSTKREYMDDNGQEGETRLLLLLLLLCYYNCRIISFLATLSSRLFIYSLPNYFTFTVDLRHYSKTPRVNKNLPNLCNVYNWQYMTTQSNLHIFLAVRLQT